MAWRIEDAVERGVIDNTVAGRTSGRVWLRGRAEPLRLSLDGDCWRDLAGTRLDFVNPAPCAGGAPPNLESDQSGLVGDITASLKARNDVEAPDGDSGWHNRLYIEWFSAANGRVLIETAAFRLRVSPHLWRMDEDAEVAQKLANLQAMRDFLSTMIQRRNNPKSRRRRENRDDDEYDEHEWEELLRESDRVSLAYGEAVEKYGEDPDSERKEAFVMGWDSMLSALADRDEAAQRGDNTDDDDDDDEPDGDAWENLDEDDPMWDDDTDYEPDFESEDQDPLIHDSTDLCLRALDLVDQEAPTGSAADRLSCSLMEVSGKLGGALYAFDDSPMENGYIMAILKRCLGFLNEGIGACRELADAESDPDHAAALRNLLADMFKIRDHIVERRREIRGGR